MTEIGRYSGNGSINQKGYGLSRLRAKRYFRSLFRTCNGWIQDSEEGQAVGVLK